MLNLSARHQFFIGLFLIALMMVTRGHHFDSLNHLPSASWAVFFLAGLYIAKKWLFPFLLSIVFFMDFVVSGGGAADSFCLTPAYSMLIPAYGSLWLAGRWYAKHHQFNLKSLFTLVLTVIIAAAITSIFSGGGFYFFSGRFTEPTMLEYSTRFMKYYPRSLTNLAFYIGLAAIIHSYISLSIGAHKKINSSTHY